MIITLAPSASASDIEGIQKTLKEVGWSSTSVVTQVGHYVVGIGSKEFDIRRVGSLTGVRDVHRVSDPYKLVSRQWKVGHSVIEIGDSVRIGDGSVVVMAGPCSIESEAQVNEVATFLKATGVKVMRGGAFKPRSSPYSFRGLGLEGLTMFYKGARAQGLCVISEVMDPSQIEGMHDYVDIFQVGTRNSQNFSLFGELGKIKKPVLIKRGMSGTLEELLQAAEYVFSTGNEKVILCERGIRTFEKAYRNTLDLNAVPYLKEKSHLPVVVDPSHGIGIRQFVSTMALASVVAGADGLLIEIHSEPEKAASDGAQTLNFPEFEDLLKGVRALGSRDRDL